MSVEQSCLTSLKVIRPAARLVKAQQMWAPLGVKLAIQQMDIATLDDRYHKNDFQLRTAYWTNDIADPSEISSYFAYFPNIQCQHSGWKSERADQLFEQSQVEQDPARRADEYKEIQRIYMAAAPVIWTTVAMTSDVMKNQRMTLGWRNE